MNNRIRISTFIPKTIYKIQPFICKPYYFKHNCYSLFFIFYAFSSSLHCKTCVCQKITGLSSTTDPYFSLVHTVHNQNVIMNSKSLRPQCLIITPISHKTYPPFSQKYMLFPPLRFYGYPHPELKASLFSFHYTDCGLHLNSLPLFSPDVPLDYRNTHFLTRILPLSHDTDLRPLPVLLAFA